MTCFTDPVQFQNAYGLSPPAVACSGVTASAKSWSFFDSVGRYIQVVGTPTTVTFPNSQVFGGVTPLNVPNQPAGTDTSHNITGTYDGEVTVNMVTHTVYATGNQQYAGGGSVTAYLATSVAVDGDSGVQSVTGLATALSTGAIAVGAVFEADAYAAGTNTIALLLNVGGDGTHATNSLLTLASGAAANSPNNMIVLKADAVNPVQPGGSIMTVAGSHLTAAMGIDLSAATFTGAAFRSTGFNLDALGSIQSGTTTKQFSESERISVGNGSIAVMPGAVTTPGLYLGNEHTGSVTNVMLYAWTGSSWAGVGGISNNGSSTSFNTTSDGRLKTVTGTLSAPDVFDRLDAVTFDWKQDGAHDVGFVAQDTYKVVPMAVMKPEADDGLWMMDNSKLVPYLWAELKAVRARLAVLEARDNPKV